MNIQSSKFTALLLWIIPFLQISAINAQPLTSTQPEIADFGAIGTNGSARFVTITTTSNAARLRFDNATPENISANTVQATLAPGSAAILSSGSPVTIQIHLGALSTFGSISAKVRVTFVNDGPPLPNLPTGSAYTVTFPAIGLYYCDASQPNCSMPGLYCQIDRNNETHLFISNPRAKEDAWPSIQDHLQKHFNAQRSYEMSVKSFVDKLGLTQYLTQDPCASQCPGGCCLCQSVCGAPVQFTKGSPTSKIAAFKYSHNAPLEFRGEIPQSRMRFVLRFPRTMSGFTVLTASNSQFIFTDRENQLYMEVTDSNSVQVFQAGAMCIGISTDQSVVRRFGGPGVTPIQLNVRIGQ
jgi:hypothetical protein